MKNTGECTPMMFRNLTFALCLLVVFLLAAPAVAEEKCPPCEPKENPRAWKKSFALGFNMTDGNSETSLLNVRAKIAREKGKDVWIFDLEQGWGETTDQATSETSTNVDFTKGHATYQQLLGEGWFVGSTIDALRDEIADVRYRVVPALTFGNYIVKDSDLSLSLEAGPAYVTEEVGDVEDDYAAGKVGNRFTWKISDTASVFQNAYGLVQVDDSDNYIINGEAGIQTAVTSMLSLALTISDKYDNRPAAGKKRNDVSLVSSLIVNF
jgi:putative salt-induced outer membrane protein YdiY